VECHIRLLCYGFPRQNFTAALALRIDYALGEADERRKEDEESDQ